MMNKLKLYRSDTFKQDFLAMLALAACIASVACLVFVDFFSARDREEPAFICVVKGINLVEFSGWGGITLLLPVMLATLQLSCLDRRGKNILWFLLNIGGAYSISEAYIAAKMWIRESVNVLITFEPGQAAFVVLLSLASALTFAVIQRKNKNLGFWTR